MTDAELEKRLHAAYAAAGADEGFTDRLLETIAASSQITPTTGQGVHGHAQRASGIKPAFGRKTTELQNADSPTTGQKAHGYTQDASGKRPAFGRRKAAVAACLAVVVGVGGFWVWHNSIIVKKPAAMIGDTAKGPAIFNGPNERAGTMQGAGSASGSGQAGAAQLYGPLRSILVYNGQPYYSTFLLPDSTDAEAAKKLQGALLMAKSTAQVSSRNNAGSTAGGNTASGTGAAGTAQGEAGATSDTAAGTAAGKSSASGTVTGAAAGATASLPQLAPSGVRPGTKVYAIESGTVEPGSRIPLPDGRTTEPAQALNVTPGDVYAVNGYDPSVLLLCVSDDGSSADYRIYENAQSFRTGAQLVQAMHLTDARIADILPAAAKAASGTDSAAGSPDIQKGAFLSVLNGAAAAQDAGTTVPQSTRSLSLTLTDGLQLRFTLLSGGTLRYGDTVLYKPDKAAFQSLWDTLGVDDAASVPSAVSATQ